MTARAPCFALRVSSRMINVAWSMDSQSASAVSRPGGDDKVTRPGNDRVAMCRGLNGVDVAALIADFAPNHWNEQRTLAASKSRQFTLVYKRCKNIEKPATYCHNSRCSASLSGGEPRSAYRIGIARSGLTSAFSGDRKNVWHATPQNCHHESP